MADSLGMTSERRTWLIMSIVACAVAVALPSAASAADYCVDTACAGTNVNSIEQAFEFADDDSALDRIYLGPSVYTAQNSWGFTYNGSPIEIIGAGRGKTILTAPPSSSRILSMAAVKGTSIHDLTIRIPEWASQPMIGLESVNDVKRVNVTEDPKQLKAHTGAHIWGGATLEDSSVDMGGDGPGVVFYAGGGAVRDSVIRGKVGIETVYGGVSIERSRVLAYDVGVQADRDVITISDSLIHLMGYSNVGTGIRADTQSGSGTNVTVKADGVTISTPSFSNYGGVSASTFDAPGLSAEVDLTNSVVRGAPTALSAYAFGMGGATVKAAYSDYDPAENKHLGGSAHIDESNVSNVGDAGFADAANGDFHLLPGSKLLDQGDPATPQNLDLDRNPLVADGDADGSARRDMGAYELQPPAPAAGEPGGEQPGGGEPGGGQPAPDTVAPVIRGIRMTRKGVRYSLSETARIGLTIKRADGRRYRTVARLARNGAAGRNALRFSRRLSRRTLRPGRYRAVIRATDAAGNRSAARTIKLSIARVRL
jgi:hypothetical protein